MLDRRDLLQGDRQPTKETWRSEVTKAVAWLEMLHEELETARPPRGRPPKDDYFFFAFQLAEAFTILTGAAPIYHEKDVKKSAVTWRPFLSKTFILCGLWSGSPRETNPLSAIFKRLGGVGSDEEMAHYRQEAFDGLKKKFESASQSKPCGLEILISSEYYRG